jgi:hypothetical protein
MIFLVIARMAELVPMPVIELNPWRGKKLLECPTALEPYFLRKVRDGRRVCKKNYTYLCVPVPFEHGPDGLVELRTAPLVDAARVGPSETTAVLPCFLAKIMELDKSRPCRLMVPFHGHLLKSWFPDAEPSMRKNCISQITSDHVRKFVFGNKVLADPDQFWTEQIHQSFAIDKDHIFIVVRNV